MLQLTKKEYQDFLRCQIGTLEMGKCSNYYDGQFNIVFVAIKKFLTPPPIKPKPQIGFHSNQR